MKKFKVVIMEEGRDVPVLSEETSMVLAILNKTDIRTGGHMVFVGGDATADQLVAMSYATDSAWKLIYDNAPPAKLLRSLLDAVGGPDQEQIDLTELLKGAGGGGDD